MQDIIREMKFREFLYEEDPEAIVDMARCNEVLDGEWFDIPESCKVHTKIVLKSPGSTWVVAYNRMIFAHADLIKTRDSNGMIPKLRVHENFRHPGVIRKLIKGLTSLAKTRKYDNLIIFGDKLDVKDNLAKIGIKPDRAYFYVKVDEIESDQTLSYERISIHPDDTASADLTPFLGSPVPPSYILNRAYMGAENGLFKYNKPDLYRIKYKGKTYVACFDNREWHVFKEGNFKPDKEAIKPVLATKYSLNPGRILLTEKAIEAAEVIPASDGVYYDFFIKI